MLNDLPEFDGQNPSLERFASILWSRLVPSLPAGLESAVRLWEDSSAWAGYSQPGPGAKRD